ncbi:MAG: ATP-binding cassette domain-containing protein [Ruminococcus sp.]|nr:ATP-binding cassette domain-containing protein [Ruminococcus sp.]
MEFVLRTNDLVKKYRGFTALNGLTMNIPKGSIYGFVGRNGAGKTTLIRLITGLQLPTSGSFEIYGVKNTDKAINDSRKRMGAVVETPAVYQDLTAKENLKMQYRVLGLPDFKGIDELLELVGLSDTGRKKVKNFSLGMKQRLGIAVALCGSPDFIVLDEPVNGLDPQGIIDIRELILKLNHEKNITILISSHILEELSKLATHYGFIDGGKMIREMSAEELEKACCKSVRMTVTDTGVLSRVLDEMGVDYKILDSSTADVFAKLNFTQTALKLSEQGCDVITMEEKDESLESFYISLVGGGEK